VSEAVIIRPATLEDMAACAAILNEWIDATDYMPRVHTRDNVVQHYRKFVFEEREVHVADRAGEIAGYVVLSDDDYVTSLYVKVGERGARLGQKMIDHAKDQRPGGLKLWTFVANTGARRFYERERFVETKRSDGDNEERLPDILYAWQGGE